MTHRSSVFRWFKRVVYVVVGLAGLLLFAGYAYQQVRMWQDTRAYPPIGRLIRVEGRNMHLYCTGTGRATVVLESGHGGTWMDWALIQPEVAGFTRVCSYDREGMGWSDPGPPPRTSSRIALELEELLSAAREKPPYVLAGHSIGGYHVRVFADRYREKVGGLILVDAAHEEMFQRLPAEVVRQIDEFAAQLRWFQYSMYVGLPRLMDVCGQVFPGMEDLKGRQTMNQCRATYMQTLRQELDAARSSAAEAGATHLPPNLPLIALSRDYSEPEPGLPPEIAEKARVAGMEMQQELASLTTAGRLITVEKSGHYIQIDRPAVVIQAIREMVETINH